MVPGIPFLFSVVLSLSTVGRNVHWQDSGFFLSNVKEMGVLYPHGFVLYQLLCKIWTLALNRVDFTLAVHLFSSFCAALAAGALAAAAKELLLSRGALFRVIEDDPGIMADLGAAGAGCIAAAGYTFWFSGIYAKGYALYYLVLSLLMFWMVRADSRRDGRSFTAVAALIGLAWQAHPSASMLGLALVLFVVFHRKTMGLKGIGWRTSLAAAAALAPSLIILPILAANGSTASFGDPRGSREILAYLLGERFVSGQGKFAWDWVRWESVCRYFWEDMLGVGALSVGVGLSRIGLANRRLLLSMGCWVLPVAAAAATFKIEGMHDSWLVAAWLPLYLAGAVGLCWIGRAAGRLGIPAVGGLVAAGSAWSVLANGADLNQKNYDLAEIFGKIILGTPREKSIVIVTSDDAASVGLYLQKVRGFAPDVLLVRASRLASGHGGCAGWYEDALRKLEPALVAPHYDLLGRKHRGISKVALASASFAEANAGRGRAIYIEEPPPEGLVGADMVWIPAGVLWKLVPKGEARLDQDHWKFPVEPEELRGRFRRYRVPRVIFRKGKEITIFEPYERRLFIALLRARLHLAEWHYRRGQAAAAAGLYESVARAEPETLDMPEVVFPLAVCLHSMGDHARAEPLLVRALASDLTPEMRASALIRLGEICAKGGRGREADQHYERALSIPGIDPTVRRELERRRQSR